ncbi:hypothetical protein B0T26DRAFT_787654 [Lasiosphaeria miniovina]|uniref:Uncharacterized protein n=1 Tax=Lasiosphaeria miniovina TaxID=1954250 RepID=A0AA40A6I7_9PEZI|nr:uncharacterized protein B0T26DRAFT_787654 [Lasiosphaeria miniovina]KAK0710244.1 hypothetical protein B0T26DRAFT_787654 [Lasiosphaeria miniovina]
MAKRFTWSILLLPLVLLLHAGVFVGEILVLHAGTGAIDSGDRLPSGYGLYTVLIEADEYSYGVEGGGDSVKGLPDSHDFSRNKDWFAIYAGAYCSGKKHGPDRYEATYCSPWAKQFFDLQWLWRVWGVDLVEKNFVGSNPQIIFGSLLAAVITTALTAVFGLFAFCSHWSIVIAAVVTWIATAATITATLVAHFFAKKFVHDISDIKLSGTGKLVVSSNGVADRVGYTASALALVASLLWAFIAWRERRRVRSERSGRGRGRTSYKHLSVPGEGTGEELNSLRYASQVDLVQPRSRAQSMEPPVVVVVGAGGGAAYEPMRHRDVG